jgi:transposase-like protein
VLCVETIGKIRRRRLVQGDSISAIARDLGLARNTVKRALRFEGEAYEYRRKRQPVPKLERS